MTTDSGTLLRRPFIAGNWKMNLTLREAVALTRAILDGTSRDGPSVPGPAGPGAAFPEILLAPPFTALTVVSELLRGRPVALGAQNMHWEAAGAFTGEVSPSQLRDAGCSHVILGHSERRRLFGESDPALRKKLEAALAQRLVPILCVGETLEERETHQTYRVLESQIRGGLRDFAPGQLQSLIIAYEPVWAIGTGKTASPQQAQDAHLFLRKALAKMHGEGLARALRILYGGSVTPDNVDALMSQDDVDGALVGGASLKAASFLRIVRFQAKRREVPHGPGS